MDKSYKRIYPTNREFIKRLKHNNFEYVLRSIYDSDDKYDFNAAVKYNKLNKCYDFTTAVKNKRLLELV